MCRVTRSWWLAVLFVGCASVGSVQRADTLGTGNLEVGLEPGAQVYGGARGAAPLPHIDGSLRIGVSERVDLGLRVGFPWAELQGKVLLTTPGAPRLAVSLAPSFGVTVLPVNGSVVKVLHGALPVLIGFKFGEHELVLGPRVMTYGTLEAMGGVVLAPGATIGIAFQITNTFGLMPEVGFVVPVIGLSGTGLSAMQTGSISTIGQFRLGLLIGRHRAR